MYRLVLLSTLALLRTAAAQEPHIHGENVPDWYDPSCCNRKDCKPVNNDADIEFGGDGIDNVWVIYKPTGNTFYKYQFKKSQDERYHVCINPAAGLNGSLCFYVRTEA